MCLCQIVIDHFCSPFYSSVSLLACDILQWERCSCSDAAQQEFPHREMGHKAQHFSKEAPGYDLLGFPALVLSAGN